MASSGIVRARRVRRGAPRGKHADERIRRQNDGTTASTVAPMVSQLAPESSRCKRWVRTEPRNRTTPARGLPTGDRRHLARDELARVLISGGNTISEMWRRLAGVGLVVVTLGVVGGCSDEGSSRAVSGVMFPIASTTSSIAMAESLSAGSSVRKAPFEPSVFPMSFDDEAVFGLLVHSSSDLTQTVARFDPVAGRVTASVEVRHPIAMRRAGAWLWVVRDTDPSGGIPVCCSSGVDGEVMWFDPVTLAQRGSLAVAVSGALQVVGQSLWVGTTDGIVRLSLADGHLLDAMPMLTGQRIGPIATSQQPGVVYAVVEYPGQRFSVVKLDAAGTVLQTVPTVSALGVSGLSAGAAGLWLSSVSGSLGGSVKLDPRTLEATDVSINDSARPRAVQGDGVLWVDGSWAGFIGCVEPTTGEILWRQDSQHDRAVTFFAAGATGIVAPYRGWNPIAPPANCKPD